MSLWLGAFRELFGVVEAYPWVSKANVHAGQEEEESVRGTKPEERMRLHLSRGTCATAARQDKLALGGARVLRGRNKSKRTERRDDNARKGREVGARRTGSARCVATRAAKGFGLGTGTQPSAKIPNGYLRVAELSSLEEKPNGREAVILGKWRVIVFSFEGELFITEANSTAFEFPLIDAEIGELLCILQIRTANPASPGIFVGCHHKTDRKFTL